MYSGLTGALETGRALCLGLGMGLEAAGGLMYEALGVGLEEVGSEGGSVQWLMIVESVFRGSLVEARGVMKRGASPKYMWTSPL